MTEKTDAEILRDLMSEADPVQILGRRAGEWGVSFRRALTADEKRVVAAALDKIYGTATVTFDDGTRKASDPAP